MRLVYRFSRNPRRVPATCAARSGVHFSRNDAPLRATLKRHGALSVLPVLQRVGAYTDRSMGTGFSRNAPASAGGRRYSPEQSFRETARFPGRRTGIATRGVFAEVCELFSRELGF